MPFPHHSADVENCGLWLCLSHANYPHTDPVPVCGHGESLYTWFSTPQSQPCNFFNYCVISSNCHVFSHVISALTTLSTPVTGSQTVNTHYLRSCYVPNNSSIPLTGCLKSQHISATHTSTAHLVLFEAWIVSQRQSLPSSQVCQTTISVAQWKPRSLFTYRKPLLNKLHSAHIWQTASLAEKHHSGLRPRVTKRSKYFTPFSFSASKSITRLIPTSALSSYRSQHFLSSVIINCDTCSPCLYSVSTVHKVYYLQHYSF